MKRGELDSLAMFLTLAEERSFTRAAAKLGISQSALSHSMRRLETKLGLRLMTRTTRSVAATQAGERLIEALRPALEQIDERLELLTNLRDRPAGAVRISAGAHAARTVLWPAVDRLTAQHPEINVEVNVEGGLIDIVAERYDAGVRLGERLEQDMIAVRIGPRLRMAAFGAPAYFTERGIPRTPYDLAEHNCINLRLPSSRGLYAWEFEKGGKSLKVRVEGQLIFNDVDMITEAALAGHGIGFLIEDHVMEQVGDGMLVRVLEDWCEPFDGYFLYYPSRRQPSVAFSLLLEALRYRD